jgi:predicted MFS family arabinose efflux permease
MLGWFFLGAISFLIFELLYADMGNRPNVAPPIGPILGSVIADRLRWPYIFWLLCILSCVTLFVIFISLPETARRIVGNGSIPPRGIYKCWSPKRQYSGVTNSQEDENRSLRRLPESIRSLKVIGGKDSLILLLCNGIFYAAYCCLQTSLSSLFIELYGYGEIQAGLIYIPFGVGCLVASFVSGIFQFKYITLVLCHLL